jgi:hypothetical protein
MKTTFIAIMLFFHSAIFSGKDPAEPVKSGNPVPEATDGFTLARSDENIRILYRWVNTDAPQAVRQLKAEFIADCPVNRILDVIHDDNHFQEWMSNTKLYYRVKSVDTGNWYSYVQFSLPWPLSNQDCILHYQLKTPASPDFVQVFITGEPAFLREFKGVKRISHLEIQWKLRSIGHGRTWVEYFVLSNQVSDIPKTLTDPIIQKNLLRTMNAFRETVRERRAL